MSRSSYNEEYSLDELQNISDNFKRIGNKIYLDNAGTTLYSEKQIDSVSELLKGNLFCNPHTCKITGDIIDQVRYKILQHFNTNANKYSVVFTSGATASLKTVAECFDFGLNGTFYYCQENHTSVLGMRDVVQTNNISVLKRNEILENLMNENDQQNSKKKEVMHESHSLITFSAQCNLSGYKLPLETIQNIHKEGLINYGTYVRGMKPMEASDFYICLDAASFVATNLLDLELYKPDFVCISFYKMFGYPTGLGALIVSNRGREMLKKRFYGGGTVKIAMTLEDFHEKRDGFTEQFEDGTLSFLSICALLEGFRAVDSIIPNKNGLKTMERISKHVFELAKYCYHTLKSFKHTNGNNLIEFYNHTDFKSIDEQGGIICFNIKHDNGDYIGFAEVACIAAVHNVILRTGCFCNPGACQSFLELTNKDIKKHFEAGHICSDYNDLVDGQPTGGVRLSFGYMTTKEQVDTAIDMIKNCYLEKTVVSRIDTIVNGNLPRVLSHIPSRLKQKLSKVHLRKIFIYPIKSCAALEVNNWQLNGNGLKYDRCWMIVDSNGMALTQKTIPQLCMIAPVLHLSEEKLQLNYPNIESISIPLICNEDHVVKSSICQSKVCGDVVEGLDCGNEVANWLVKALQIPGLRLIQQNFARHKKDGSPKELNLSNQAQFLLINKTSVTWLASKVTNWDGVDGSDLSGLLARFRGNFIIETSAELAENDFKKFEIGQHKFKIIGSCTRCQMICIDQKDGRSTTEPLKTIAKEFKGKIKFGIYLSLMHEPNTEKYKISCDDEVLVN